MTGGEITGIVALNTVITGLVATLVKWLADVSSHRIARTEQAVLDERIKKIESQLTKESLEHEVRFRRIDKEMADVLSNAYDKLFVLFDCSYRFVCLGNYIQIVDGADTRTPQEREKEAHGRVEEANRVFKESFFRKRLYIPEDLFLTVKNFHCDLVGTVSEFVRDLARARKTGRDVDSDKWQSIMDRLDGEYTRLLDEITEAFQKKMGL